MTEDFDLPEAAAELFFEEPAEFQKIARDVIEKKSAGLEPLLGGFGFGGDIDDIEIESVQYRRSNDYDGLVHVKYIESFGDGRCSSVRKTEQREAHLWFSFDPETLVLTVWERADEIRAPDE
ncbi:hypothetical protein [Prosthecobacter dejongeii]|uniref:Uncharacterized protein n=1 Tax=Prosthecobacter dejongeii TaxID=48465 RepID=A0A7W7YJN1_9BACT|nr:hypothetical protein [Prosthecobacter dejongeii]MBB5037391.1 hypothetical protein [Prosthecobacter dejongeii]